MAKIMNSVRSVKYMVYVILNLFLFTFFFFVRMHYLDYF